MKRKLLIINLIILIKIIIFSSELEYKYLNIYNSDNTTLNHNIYNFASKYIDLDYSKQKYKSSRLDINPEFLKLKLKTKYYDFSYGDFSFNNNYFYIEDELIHFKKNNFLHYQHTLKIPYKNFEFQYIIGNSEKRDFNFMSDIADINFKNFELNNYGYHIKYNYYTLGYNYFELNSSILLNNVSDIGKINGNVNEYFIKHNKFKVSYRKIKSYSYFNIDQYSAFLISNLTNKFLYGKLNIDAENYDLEYSYSKKWENSKFSIKNNFGIIINNNSYISLDEEYYKIELDLFLWKIRKKTREVNKIYNLKNKVLYYDLINLNYEKYFNDLTIGVNKFIPLGINFEHNKEIRDTSSKDDNSNKSSYNSNDSSSHFNFSNIDWEKVIFTGLSIYLKYDF